MAFTPPKYPKELTEQYWKTTVKPPVKNTKHPQTDDGTAAQREIAALQKAFTAINWKFVDFELEAPGHLGSRTPEQIKEGIANARKASLAIKPVYDLARGVESKGGYLVATWKNVKGASKSSIEAAKKVEAQAKWLSYQIALGTLAGVTEDGIKKEAAARKTNEDIVKKALKDLPAKLKALAKDCDSGVQVAGWGGFWMQNVRFLGTQMAQVLKLDPGLATEVAAVRVHSNKQRTPQDQHELDGWLVDLARAARALDAKLHI